MVNKSEILTAFWKIYEMNGAADAIRWLDVVKYDVYERLKQDKKEQEMQEFSNLIEKLII